jgi:hypothetical protein
MMSSAELALIEKQHVCGNQFVELAELAGIAKEVEHALSPHTPLHWDSDAPSGSERAERENAEYWEDQRRTTDRLLREAIFSVSDVEMRKRLIAKSREVERLRRELFVLLANDAEATLEKVRIPRPTWLIWAAVVSAASVAAGYQFLGIPGAMGGAVVGFFVGRYFEQLSKVEHDHRLNRAEKDLKEANASKTKILNEPPTFSRWEEKTGEPDSDTRGLA